MEDLREALERWSAGYETMRPPADETEALHDSHVRLTLAAARSVLDGQEIQWCETHSSPQHKRSEHCHYWYTPAEDAADDWCRMVVRLLVETPE